jgi:hypothetical protein
MDENTCAASATFEQIEAFMSRMGRLVQCWRDGLLTPEQFQAAKADLLNWQEEIQPLPWERDDVVVPLD